MKYCWNITTLRNAQDRVPRVGKVGPFGEKKNAFFNARKKSTLLLCGKTKNTFAITNKIGNAIQDMRKSHDV